MKTPVTRSFTLALAALAAWGVLTALADKPEHKTARADFDTSPPGADPMHDSAGNPAVAPEACCGQSCIWTVKPTVRSLAMSVPLPFPVRSVSNGDTPGQPAKGAAFAGAMQFTTD